MPVEKRVLLLDDDPWKRIPILAGLLEGLRQSRGAVPDVERALTAMLDPEGDLVDQICRESQGAISVLIFSNTDPAVSVIRASLLDAVVTDNSVDGGEIALLVSNLALAQGVPAVAVHTTYKSIRGLDPRVHYVFCNSVDSTHSLDCFSSWFSSIGLYSFLQSV